MLHHPDRIWILIGLLVVGTVLVSRVMGRGNGGHVWSPGAALRAPAGDPMTVTRHAWRPGAEGTVRVDVLVRRIEAERAEKRRAGRRRLDDKPPAAVERQAREDTGPLRTHYPLLTHAA